MSLAAYRTVFFFLVLLCARPVHADPLIFFLMSAARELASSAAAKALTAPATEVAPEIPAAPASTYPGTAVEPEILRRVIDESFVYLSEDQRREVFDKLNEMLLDPKFAANRASLIEYFLHRALAVRAAQMQLAQLSSADKENLALRFKEETAALPEEERQKLLKLLEQRLLPVPSDLNQLLLAGLQEKQ